MTGVFILRVCWKESDVKQEKKQMPNQGWWKEFFITTETHKSKQEKNRPAGRRASKSLLSHINAPHWGIYKLNQSSPRPIPFLAFWLRSSVVSVLISLISDTRFIEPCDINLIFLVAGLSGSLLPGSACVALDLDYFLGWYTTSPSRWPKEHKTGWFWICIWK